MTTNNKTIFATSASQVHMETIWAMFIIALFSLFLIANYFAGFSMLLYVIVVVTGGAIAVAYPRSGLNAIVILTFIFERFFTLIPIVLGRSEYKIYPIDILLVAMLVGIALQWMHIKSENISLKKVDYLLIALIFLSGIYFATSFMTGGDAALGFSTLKNYAFYPLFYFATAFLLTKKDELARFAKFIFGGAVLIIGFIVYGFVTGNGLWSEYTPLSTSGIRILAFPHAFYLSMALIMALVYIAYRSDRFSKWLLLLVPIWVVGIMGSMMRHLWISLFATTALLIIVFTGAQRERLRHYASVYAVFAMLIIFVAGYGATMFPRSAFYQALGNATGMISSRVTSVADTSGDESIIWRSAVWQQAGKQYIQNPVFGIGFGKKVSVEIGKYRDFVEVRNIHNSFLVVLVQMGILGLGLLGALTGILGWKILRNKFKEESMQMTAYISLGILVLHLSAFMFQPYLEANLLGIFFWINLGLMRRIYDSVNKQ